MNYREQQLRQKVKRDYVLLKDYRDLEEQFRLTKLDVDYQIQVQTKQENERLKQTIQEWEERYNELETNLNQQAQQANQAQKAAQETQTLLNQKIQALENQYFERAPASI